MKPFLVLLLSLLCSPCWAQNYWDWSPAAYHHRATVKVQAFKEHRYVDGQQVAVFDGGSGTVVRLPGGMAAVVTCAHVATAKKCNVEFHDGTKAELNAFIHKVFSDDPNNSSHDMAILLGPIPARFPRITLADHPPAGARIEVVSYGGENSSKRSFYGQVINAEEARYSCCVVSGDSGGGVFNDRHELVGIIGYGNYHVGNFGQWHVLKPSGGCRPQPFKRFAAFMQSRFGRNCAPGSDCWRGGDAIISNGSPPRGGGLYPPDTNVYPPAVDPPSQPVPPQVASAPKLEIGQTVTVGPGEPARVEMRLENDKYVLDFYIPRGDRGAEGQAGSQGVAGPAGPPGPQGPAGSGGEIDANAIAALIKQQVEQGVALQIQHGLAGVDDKIDSKLAGLPPLRFRHVVKDKDGNVVEVLRDDLVPLGGQLDFHFREKE